MSWKRSRGSVVTEHRGPLGVGGKELLRVTFQFEGADTPIEMGPTRRSRRRFPWTKSLSSALRPDGRDGARGRLHFGSATNDGMRISYARGMTPTAKKATYADLEAVPSNLIAEILGGVLYTQPRPASRHARATSCLGADLVVYFDRGRAGPGGWIILDKPELHVGEDVVVPDIARWRRTRMPEVPDTPAFSLAPDWVCEALSPGTAGRDRTVKLEIYRREGVGHLWFLDPVAKTLEVLRLDGEGYRVAATFAGDGTVEAEPFDAVGLELGGLWISEG